MIARFLAAVLVLAAWPALARTVPTADVVVYVDVAGSDSTGDGTAAHPWATPQHAVDELYATYDLACQYKATIQLAAAALGSQNYYPGVLISGRLVGQCGGTPPLVVGTGLPPLMIGKYLPFTIQGDLTGNNPLGAFIAPGLGAIPKTPCISLSDGAFVKVLGLACDTTNAGQDGFDVFTGSLLDMSFVWFGHAGYPGSSYNSHISVAWDATLLITGNYGFSGEAASHIAVGATGKVYVNNNGGLGAPVVVTANASGGTLAFPSGFIQSDNGILYLNGLSFVVAGGTTVNGLKTLAIRNGVIDTNTGNTTPHSCNPSFFPGVTAPIIQDNAVCR